MIGVWLWWQRRARVNEVKRGQQGPVVPVRDTDIGQESRPLREDGTSPSRLDATPEDGSRGLDEASPTSEIADDGRSEHREAHLGCESGSESAEPEKRPATQAQTDGEVAKMESGNVIDESVAGRAADAIRSANAEGSGALHAPEAECSQDHETRSEGEQSGGTGPTTTQALAVPQAPVPDQSPASDAWADRERDEDAATKDGLGQTSETEEAQSREESSQGGTASDAHQPPEAQPGRHGGDQYEGQENDGGDHSAGAVSATSLRPPNKDGEPATEARTAPGDEGDADHKQNLETTKEKVRRPSEQKKQPAVYRDRRGLRRAVVQTSRPDSTKPSPPAEARLRLLLDPVQRRADLSVILARPEGFPARISPLLDGHGPVEAFDASRYDDLDLVWTDDLLDGELRIQSAEGQQWLRAARPIHLFADNAAESGMISVGAARQDVAHAVICRADKEGAVRAAAMSTGSPSLVSHDRWTGVPDGWVVLTGHRPRQAATPPLPIDLSSLNPGTAVEISLSGGLAIREKEYAQGRPPKIGIAPLPDGATVTIGGIAATQTPDGAWKAPGWETPGHHLVDVVPGPSLTYRIAADPMAAGEWQFWDAHPERFGSGSREPWGRAVICGAAVQGPEGETVIAALRLPVLVALGSYRQAVRLTPRRDAPAAVAMTSEAASFLVAATGVRRKQGRLLWLGSVCERGSHSHADHDWAAIVRSIAARRLRLDNADRDAERIWRNTRQRARRIWRTK